MNQRIFQDWCKQFPGIIPALRNVDGTSDLIEEISVRSIDFNFLATVPINMYSCYVSPEIYVVWSDGQIDDILVKEIYSSVSRREEFFDFVSWQEEIVSYPITIEQPIATYFKKRHARHAVDYVIVILRSGGSEIENLKITLYKLPKDFDLRHTVLEITAAFENGGWRGIEDLKSRFETGVGIGLATPGDRAEVLNHSSCSSRFHFQ